MPDTSEETKVHRPRKWFSWLWVAVLAAGATAYVFFVFPSQGIGPRQPISFSHRNHAGVKQINCRF